MSTSTQAAAHTIHYTVDDEPQSTHDKFLTPTQILKNAGFDPGSYYLVEILGDHDKSYKDDPNVEIRMHDHQKFLTVFTGPTPVS